MNTEQAKPYSSLPILTQLPPARVFRDERLKALEALAGIRDEIGKIAGIAGEVVFVTSPEAVHEVLVSQARSFEKSPVLRMALHPLAGEGLFTSEGALWKRQRKLMSPIFQPNQIKQFASQMADCAERAADSWSHNQMLDIAHETTRIAMAVAGKTLFDIDTFSESDELEGALTVALTWSGAQAAALPLLLQARLRTRLLLTADHVPAFFADKLHEAAQAMIKPLMIPGESTREVKRALLVLDRRVERMIEERRRGAGSQNDLLSRLLSARDEDDGGTMTDKQVRDEVLTLFVAGHETTATGLAWAIMEMCKNPDVYTKAKEEALALSGPITFDDLPRLPYNLRVFKEALRLYPPVFMFGRQAVADVAISGYVLPKGTIVMLCPYAIQRHPDFYPDPERFDPDRFLPEVEAARPRGAYFPFSLGPRTCIGNHFALMEGPIVLATLLRHADFELVNPRGTEPDPGATLRPKGGIFVRAKLRN